MKKGSIQILQDKNGASKAMLTLADELTYSNVVDLKDEVLKHFKKFDQLHIQGDITQIDLTGLQLLYSIKKSCLQAKKTVVISLKTNSEMEILLKRSGFNEFLN